MRGSCTLKVAKVLTQGEAGHREVLILPQAHTPPKATKARGRPGREEGEAPKGTPRASITRSDPLGTRGAPGDPRWLMGAAVKRGAQAQSSPTAAV